jgi:hypothetical protein
MPGTECGAVYKRHGCQRIHEIFEHFNRYLPPTYPLWGGGGGSSFSHCLKLVKLRKLFSFKWLGKAKYAETQEKK